MNLDLDLTCRSCGGKGTEWRPLFSSDRNRKSPCEPCRGTGELDLPVVALDVARAHGTTVAADWSGMSPTIIRRLRHEADGYVRGRGRPSRAEMDAAPPRLTCDCVRCIDWRTDQANRRGSPVGTRAGNAAILTGWADHAACIGHDPDLFFPSQGESTAEAKRICRSCPVRDECLEAGINERFGMWGGVSERGRRRLRRLRRIAKQAEETEVA